MGVSVAALPTVYSGSTLLSAHATSSRLETVLMVSKVAGEGGSG
jgi:hypothetical protein